jgi:ornithine cyclodeaminase/alanine dehydrogenase-like protein (mu-crystallin family)
MKAGKLLYLTREDVKKCGISLKEAIGIAERTFEEHEKGSYEMPPKPGVHPSNCPGAFLHAMPGYLPGMDIAGLKWVGVFTHNTQKYQIPSLSGVLILNDVETGYPVAIMEAGLITATRTASTSGVSAKYLAKKDSEVLGIIGAGEQGRFNTEALNIVLPNLKEVKVFDLYPEFAEKFAEDMSEKISKTVTVCKSAEEVIRVSDVVVSAAACLGGKPVYKKEWLKKDALVLPVHVYGWEFSAFKEASKFVNDDWNQWSNYAVGPDNYYQEAPKLYAQLGEIVAGKKKGREDSDGVIVSASLGTALQDISLGKEILRIAREKNLGQELSL